MARVHQVPAPSRSGSRTGAGPGLDGARVTTIPRVEERVARGWEALKQFLYGMTGHEFARHAVEMRHEMEALFMVVTMGDLIGVPVLPPIYSLRLLPYVVPEIATWKRHMARRKEFWEKDEYDLHGV